jgi:two-component system, response regulator, stage 0 sporulation protein F
MKDKTTMLYVDDEPLNLMLFEANFKRNYNVITAESGYEGLEKLRSNREIEVVISDMKMPGMDGIEFITEARRDYPKIIYFILTGYDITHEIADALNNKLIRKYFRKPFNMKEIDGSIQEAMI